MRSGLRRRSCARVEEELKRAALEQKSHEEFLRQREQQLAQWEQDVFERELSLLILHMNQDKPNVKKRKGTFKKHKLKSKNGEKISMPQDFIHKITVQASPGLEKRKNSPDLGSGSSPSFGPRFRAIQLSPSQNSRAFGLSPIWPLEPLPGKQPNGERRLGPHWAPQSPKSPKSPKVLRLSPMESSLSMRAKLLEMDSSENGNFPSEFEEYRPPTPQSTQNGSVREPPRTVLPQGDSGIEEGGSPVGSPRPDRGSVGGSAKVTHRALLDGGSLLASVALGRCLEVPPKVPPRSHAAVPDAEPPPRIEVPAQDPPVVSDLITFSQSDHLPRPLPEVTLHPPQIRPAPLTPPPPQPRHCHGPPRLSPGEWAHPTNGEPALDPWRSSPDRRRRSSHGHQLVLDLPFCTQDIPERDSPTQPPIALFPDPRLWSPKTRRLEVNVIPRPRPSPVRPRIDPWSFISAGVAGREAGRNAAKAGGPLCHQPSPTNPFTNCDPFPTPDCDPFAQRADPFGTTDAPSPFDPFSAPFRASRSAPCSTNVSPSLSALRVAPKSPAEPPPHRPGLAGGQPAVRHQREAGAGEGVGHGPQPLEVPHAARERQVLTRSPAGAHPRRGGALTGGGVADGTAEGAKIYPLYCPALTPACSQLPLRKHCAQIEGGSPPQSKPNMAIFTGALMQEREEFSHKFIPKIKSPPPHPPPSPLRTPDPRPLSARELAQPVAPAVAPNQPGLSPGRPSLAGQMKLSCRAEEEALRRSPSFSVNAKRARLQLCARRMALARNAVNLPALLYWS
ncbi:hypothetical protein SKAU_G00257250 [Synaphobranchus kaupii]|uniref:Uncharacterized protein n=1 Tax=Synaphobranchus kaupii TaxID=118154 RepID=A0A9Q1F413_SYNKA|nr:hypothetical protein SKAU_G00257250 [Synaphobranchus kaupii]